MEQSTQTNRTHIKYISIYDKPKKKMGRPVCSRYIDEEKAERARLSAMRRYYNNVEKERERNRLEYHAKIIV